MSRACRRLFVFFFQAEDGIRDSSVTGVQTCALPIYAIAGTPALVQLLAGLRSSYGVILIDSPPLGAGVDPYVLGTVSGNLLLVIRTGATDRGLMRAKLEVLERLPVRILGAVLNDVPRGALYYRYYGYLSGYSTETEKDVVRRPLSEAR